MMDDKLAREEAQRTNLYEAIKTEVKRDVGEEVAAKASATEMHETTDELAAELRAKSMNEIAATDNEIERGRFFARVSQVVDYIFLLIYGLLAVRLLLSLFGARSGNSFVQFIATVTDPIYAPFKGIVPSFSEEGFTLSLPIIIAIVAYMLLHLAINGLLRLLAHRKVRV